MLKCIPSPAKNSATASLGPLKPLFLILSLGLVPSVFATTIPEGITAGTQNVAIGEGSFASGSSSQAIGKGAIATGGNITPEDFMQAYEAYRDLVAQIDTARQGITDIERQQGVKQLEESDIQNQLTRVEALLGAANDKLQKQAEISTQKQAQETLRQQMQNELDASQQHFDHNSFNLPGNKQYVYNNFLSVLNALDWEKVKQTNGRALLVQDLKNGIEQDFGTSVVFPEEKYNTLIEGYINLQGNIAFLKKPFEDKVFAEFKSINPKQSWLYFKDGTSGYSMNPPGLDYVNFRQDYIVTNGIKVDQPNLSDDALLRRVLNPEISSHDTAPKFDVPRPALGTPEMNDWNRLQRKWYEQVYIPWRNTHMAPIELGNELAKAALMRTTRLLANEPDSKVAKLLAQYTSPNSTENLNKSGLSVLEAPVLKRAITYQEAQRVWVENTLSRLFDSYYENQPISLSQLQQIENWHKGQREFLALIDYDSNDWLFDKEEHRQFVDTKVKPFLEQVEHFTETIRRLENTSLSQEERDAIAADVIAQRQQLKEVYQNPQNYLSGFRPTQWTDTRLKELMVESRDLMLSYHDEAVRTLLPYSPDNPLVIATRIAADKQLQALTDKQAAIAQIDQQIAQLQAEWDSYRLTVDEQEAANQKAQWENRLAAKQQELQDLATQLNAQRNTLLGLTTQLSSSPLGTKGQNALAQGTNAFASGADSIATGTDALATGDRSIAQGYQAQATGTSSIAIGDTAKALRDRAIAIGHNAIANAVGAIAMGDGAGVGDKGVNAIAMGTNSMVNAENAIGIGTNTAVTGKDAVGIGANSTVTGERAVSLGAQNTVTGNQAVSIGSDNKVEYNNAVAVGSNITQTAENSVNLGNASAATVIPTAETAGMASYTYSPLLSAVYQFAASDPVGVVTVGAKGKERRVQNVAAGFIAPDSTDAINGSQLYSVIRAVDDGQIGLVRQDLTTGEVSIAGQRGGSVVNLTNAQGEARRLTGVADGVAPTDAVNMRQFNSQVGRLDGRIDKVEREVKGIKGSVANAIAMASMSQAHRPGSHHLAVSTGHSLGATALAIGYSHLSESGNVSYRLNGSASTNSSYAVGASIGYSW